MNIEGLLSANILPDRLFFSPIVWNDHYSVGWLEVEDLLSAYGTWAYRGRILRRGLSKEP